MPRKRKNFSKPKDIDADLNDDTVDPNDEDYMYDEVDKFHNNQDKALLGSASDSESSDEEEIYNVAPSSSDEDEEEDYDEDEEASEMEDDLDLPGVASSKAWGTNKKAYYDADTYDHLEGHERDEALENEAAEARKVQEELMNDFDLMQPKLNRKRKAEGDVGGEISVGDKDYIKKDYSDMTEEELKEEVAKKYPLVLPLEQMLKKRIEEFRFMEQVLQLVFLKRFKTKTSKWTVKRYLTLGNNCDYMKLYLLVKQTTHEDPNNEIEQGLLKAMQRLKKEDETMSGLKPLFEFMLSDEQKDYWLQGADKIQKPVNLKTMLKEIEEYQTNHQDEYQQFREGRISKWREDMREKGLFPKVSKKKAEVEVARKKMRMMQESSEEESSSNEEESESEEEEKREVTRQMEKNRGYKKSQASRKKAKLKRNPRVKHKEKFRRAEIRRKGAVRPVVTEVKKYQGERSGIRGTVIRSTKL